MKAFVDRETCIGCELCVQTCPDVFEMDMGGKAVASKQSVPPELEDACRQAVTDCPVDAISIREV